MWWWILAAVVIVVAVALIMRANRRAGERGETPILHGRSDEERPCFTPEQYASFVAKRPLKDDVYTAMLRCRERRHPPCMKAFAEAQEAAGKT